MDLGRRRDLMDVRGDAGGEVVVTPLMEHLEATDEQILLLMQAHRRTPAQPPLGVMPSIEHGAEQANYDEWTILSHDSNISE
jgi:hypothetical protein